MEKERNRPRFLRNNSELNKILRRSTTKYVDAFSSQIKELFFIRNTKFVGIDKNLVCKGKEFLNFQKRYQKKYAHAFLQWNNTVVKTFTKEIYLEIKTNRNKDLITREEQKELSNFTVGVFGMSVGSNISMILTQSGISNKIFLADFDELDTSNLNRIIAGIHQIGMNKTVIAARKIYEDNPFAKVYLMKDGLTKINLENLLRDKKLDCIVEEVDNLVVKIETRILAMKYKVPVLMITDNGEGVILHVERYDLGYKKIFNKGIKYWEKFLKSKMTKELIGQIVLDDIIGGLKMTTTRVISSSRNVSDGKLVSWAQLGVAAQYGAVVIVAEIKRIALGIDKQKYRHLSLFPLPFLKDY